MPSVSGFFPRSPLGGYAEPANTTSEHYGFLHHAQPAPDAFAAGLTISGARTSDFPVSSAAREVAGFLARSYFDDYYNRIHLAPNFIDVGNIAAEHRADIHVWNAYFTPQTLTTVTGITDEGARLEAGRQFPIPFAALEERLMQLVLSPVGPSEIDLALLFVFAGLPDVGVRVIGNRVVAFSWLPNWTEPGIERLEWLTDVLTSTTGTEQRRALRAEPRCRLAATFLVSDAERAFLDLALSRWAARVWAVPKAWCVRESGS